MNHSKMIHDKYGGDKNIIIVDGDHNSPRPRFLYDSVAIFLTTTLQIPEDWVLAEGHNYIRRMPWTYRATAQRGQKGASTTSSAGAAAAGGAGAGVGAAAGAAGAGGAAAAAAAAADDDDDEVVVIFVATTGGSTLKNSANSLSSAADNAVILSH